VTGEANLTTGSVALRDAHAKLRWATGRHDEMRRVFEEFAHLGGGDDRPYGIQFRRLGKLPGLVVASFIVEEPMPTEMTLLAADLVHNTRVALDHVVARLKDHFGGDPGQGGFPICMTDATWNERVAKRGKGSPLYGLDQVAVEFVYREQPLHQGEPEADPLVVLNRLDNDDKHRMLHLAFAYPEADEGLDLIEVVDGGRLLVSTNSWRSGQPLEDGTTLATFRVRGDPREVLHARQDARIGFATGTVGAPRTTYEAMIDRVRDIADKAAALIDSAK
jgi:hypothetical protein